MKKPYTLLLIALIAFRLSSAFGEAVSPGSAAAPHDTSASEPPGSASADSAVAGSAAFLAFSRAAPADRETLLQSFLGEYLPVVKAGGGVSEWDEAIADYLAPDRRSTLAARLAAEGVDSGLQAACVAANAAESLSGYVGARAAAAGLLVSGLRNDGSRPPTERAQALSYAYRFFASKRAAEALDAALEEAGDEAGAFRFRLYRYLDESKVSPLREAALKARLRRIDGLGAWTEEVAEARRLLLGDIIRSSPQASVMPVFIGDELEDERGDMSSLSFSSPGSIVYGRPAAFVFFKTTCSYCEGELKAIDSYLGRKPSPYPASVIGIGLPTGLPGSFDDIAQYKLRLGLGMPLFRAASPSMADAYGIRTVPTMLFLDESGSPLAAFSIGSDGNLAGKVAWILEAFEDGLVDADSWTWGLPDAPEPAASPGKALGLDEAGAPAILPGSVGSTSVAFPIPMDFYYDPSCGGCRELLDEYLPGLETEFGKSFVVRRADIMNGGAFDEMVGALESAGESLTATPVAVIAGTVFQGLRDIRDGAASAARSASPPGGSEPDGPAPSGGSGWSPRGSIPALRAVPVFLAGLADGVNPCAFSTLLFLISMISRAGKKRREIFWIGLVYTATVFASYLALGLGLFSSIRAMAGFPAIGRIVRAGLSIALGAFAILSFRDAYLEATGRRAMMTLTLPRRNKELIHKAIRNNLRFSSLVIGTVVTAVLVSAFELACTGQVYLPVIAWLVRTGDLARGAGYLVLYNLGFIAPLGLVFAAAWAGVTMKPIADTFSSRIWLVKLALGLVFTTFLVMNLIL